jgi:SWI/SNF-related matrix-associated actin-dependent regulator 1 of chromatin subfamily A
VAGAALAESRVKAVEEFVESYEDAGEPLVVFSAHVAPVKALAAREGWAAITGETPAEARTEIVRRFQAGELKGLACTMAAAGVGITLTRASTAVFVDLDWTPAINSQAQDRLHRIGQTAESVLYVRFTSDHPLDLHIHNLIVKKMDLIDRAIERLVKIDPNAVAADADARRRAWEQAERESQEQDRIEAKARCQRIAAGTEAEQAALTPERVEAIKGALDAMLAVCDGAVARDGEGFSKPHVFLSRWLERAGLDTEAAQRAALALLRRYPRQLRGRFPALWD